jgi:ketosteroid isomerase-like protein
VRRPLSVRDQSRRTLDQRLAIRFPALVPRNAALIAGRSPRSRLRQWLVRRIARGCLEAYNRRDLMAASLAFAPELRYYPYREFVEAGLADECYHGPAGYRRYIEATYDVWGANVRIEPTELIDTGDVLVLLADMPMRALGSGIPLAETYATVATLRNGMIVEQRDYLHHSDALERAGLA